MELEQGARRALLFIFTALWVVLNVVRVWQVSTSQHLTGGGTNPVMPGVAGRVMLVDGFVQHNGGDMASRLASSTGKLSEIAVKTLRESMAPEDPVALTELALLQFAAKDDKSAKQSLDDAVRLGKADRSHPEALALAQTVHDVYLAPALPEHLDMAAINRLHNWYQYAVLRKLAERQQDKAKLAELDSKEAEQEQNTVVVFFIAGMLIVGELLIGILVLLLAWPLRRFIAVRAEEPEPEPKWDWAMGWLAFIMWELIQVIVSLIVLTIRTHSGGSLNIATLVLMQGLIYFFSIVAILVLVVGKHRERLKQIGLQAARPFRLPLIGWLGYCGALPIIVAVGLVMSAVLKHEPQSDNPVFSLFNSPLTIADKLMLVLLVGVIGPIFEELLFRGVLYSSFRQVMRPLGAMALSAFLFSAIHVDPGAFLPIFTLGFVMAWLFEKTGSLVPNCIVHMMQNTTTTLVTLFLLS